MPISVHPRACGEHDVTKFRHHSHGGSSPRLRGTPGNGGFLITEKRFIPAPAGNTPRMWLRRTPAAVHPRACGEHENPEPAPIKGGGSSPRLRGTRSDGIIHLTEQRFIPAPAGNTFTRTWSAIYYSVHPRACGEHTSWLLVTAVFDGSSPRLRGTHAGGWDHLLCLRFIPAPAGNTGPSKLNNTLTTVHPRACGEHSSYALYGT